MLKPDGGLAVYSHLTYNTEQYLLMAETLGVGASLSAFFDSAVSNEEFEKSLESMCRTLKNQREALRILEKENPNWRRA
jgi:hypothetical protein